MRPGSEIWSAAGAQMQIWRIPGTPDLARGLHLFPACSSMDSEISSMRAHGTTLSPWKSAPNVGAVRRLKGSGASAHKAGRRFSEASDWPLRIERGHLTGSEVAVPSSPDAHQPPARALSRATFRPLQKFRIAIRRISRVISCLTESCRGCRTPGRRRSRRLGDSVTVGKRRRKPIEIGETISSKERPVGPQRRPEKR